MKHREPGSSEILRMWLEQTIETLIYNLNIKFLAGSMMWEKKFKCKCIIVYSFSHELLQIYNRNYFCLADTLHNIHMYIYVLINIFTYIRMCRGSMMLESSSAHRSVSIERQIHTKHWKVTKGFLIFGWFD
jgi:hypothetical protein